MIVTVWTISTLFVISFAINVFYLIKLKSLKNKQKINITQDAKELLSNLLQGQAVIDIRVIDPSTILLRSPR